MIDSKKPREKQVKLVWSSNSHLDPILVDHLMLQVLNDKMFLTYGQVRPIEHTADEEPVAEIRPMASIVMDQKTARKMTDLIMQHLKTESK